MDKENKKHHEMDRDASPALPFPTTNVNGGDFRGSNSTGTLNVAAGDQRDAEGLQEMAWWTSSTSSLVRGQGQDADGEVQVLSTLEMGCAISACDYGLVVRGPIELRYTPKEFCDGACMELDRWNRLTMDSNQCCERLAFVDSTVVTM